MELGVQDLSSAHAGGRSGPGMQLCQEGLSCEGGSAEFLCQECGTYQCSRCESLLHSTRELKLHSRKRLSGSSRPCELWCNPKNVVSVHCKQCGMDMCTECDSKLHQGKRREHARVELKVVSPVADSGPRKGAKNSLSPPTQTSFLLVNDKEEIMVSSLRDFAKHLCCNPEAKLKVVSIFGNTGDGKSHTLNHTFFHGLEVFRTSAHQSSCTIGIWAAYSPEYNAVFLDTEGMLGISRNENRRSRLLLKVLAISDIVIYRTRAERLHNDLFTFLGDASEAYWKYFTPELKAASDRCKLNVPLSTLGPSVIIFHETQHTELLGEGATEGRSGEEDHDKAALTEDVATGEDNGNRDDTEKRNDKSEIGGEREETLSTGTTDTGISSGVMRREERPEEASDSGGEEAEDSNDQEGGEVEGTNTVTTPSQPMSAEELLRIRFAELGRIPKAFCSVEYVGTRTQYPPTDFSGLQKSVEELLRNNAVRAPRQPEVVLKALQVLNEKFSGDIEAVTLHTFPDAYFTCPEKCLACRVRCELNMNHGKDAIPHRITGSRCKYSHQYDNKVFLCKTCFNRGVESSVVPKTSTTGETGWMGLAKYAWSGYVIECKQCGVIFRSRQHWYGNPEPEQKAVKTENKHVWPEDLPTAGRGSDNTVRRLLDGMGSVAEAVGSVSAKPTKMVGSWMADQLAPKYWVPNSKITACGECKKEFGPVDTKHHCRACGGGFCDKCSSKSMPVPWRGWGNIPVRVCYSCYKKHHGSEKTKNRKEGHSGKQNERISSPSLPQGEPSEKVTARYVGEVVQSAVGLVTGAMEYPRGVIVESARPVYWVPDARIKYCHKCHKEFASKDWKHHCRACGQGFCEGCSSQQCPVPSRGWDYPVRVCDSCAKRKDL